MKDFKAPRWEVWPIACFQTEKADWLGESLGCGSDQQSPTERERESEIEQLKKLGFKATREQGGLGTHACTRAHPHSQEHRGLRKLHLEGDSRL